MTNMSTTLPPTNELSRGARYAVLAAAFAGLVFDGFELGLMPVGALPITEGLLGDAYTKELGNIWFARFTASLMLGAAVGGIFLGNLGDRIGRARAMGVSILFYTLFAGVGMFVRSCEEMLALRFLVGLGVGGMWPNGVALVAECWPHTSRPTVSGILGAGINFGILIFSQLGRIWHLTADSWRWIFGVAAVPAVLGIVVLGWLPESPKWLASRGSAKKPAPPLRRLFEADMLRATITGIMLASIPLVAAWAGGKWMLPWARTVAGTENAGYDSTAQQWWAIGATLGSFLGAPFAAAVGRRLSYVLISIGATVSTWALFQWSAPLEPSFLYVVFVQGLIATLFFGWLPLYLPELFPVEVRATGAGLSMNIGRFVTAGGVLAASWLLGLFDGQYPAIGAACSLVYALGMFVIVFTPNTRERAL